MAKFTPMAIARYSTYRKLERELGRIPTPEEINEAAWWWLDAMKKTEGWSNAERRKYKEESWEKFAQRLKPQTAHIEPPTRA